MRFLRWTPEGSPYLLETWILTEHACPGAVSPNAPSQVCSKEAASPSTHFSAAAFHSAVFLPKEMAHIRWEQVLSAMRDANSQDLGYFLSLLRISAAFELSMCSYVLVFTKTCNCRFHVSPLTRSHNFFIGSDRSLLNPWLLVRSAKHVWADPTGQLNDSFSWDELL